MTDERWYTAAELAGLPGLPKTERSINRAADRGELVRRKRQKGKGWEYALSSLPAEAQRALIIQAARSGDAEAAGRVVEAAADEAETRSRRPHEYDRDSLWEHYDRKPEKQKALAKEKLKVFVALDALLSAGCTQQQALREVAEGTPWSWRTIRDTYHGKPGRPGLKHYDRADWLAALVPGYVGRVAKAEFSPEAWEMVKGDYLRLDAPTLSACYERLKEAAKKHGWTIPAERTVKRRIDALPHWLKVLRRQGEHAMLQLYPAMQRSVRELHAMEWINGDGYKHNVFVKMNPDDPNETPFRPKTWFWQDVHSRKLLGWTTDETEHSDMIRAALGKVIATYGIPDHATIDNTRAAANKWLTGGVPNRYRFKVLPEDPIGLFPALGVQVHWTSVQAGKGHGQAKPVERSFGVGGVGEYVDKHPLLAGAYTGANPMAKPDNYGSRAVSYETFKQALEEGVAMWNAKTMRDTEMAGGVLSYDQVFEQSYTRTAIRKATEAQQRLWMLAAESVRVAKDGSITLDAGGAHGVGRNRYHCEAMLEFVGHKVVARFDPDRLHEEVHTYTLDGRYIGLAECVMAAGFGDHAAGRQYNRGKRQWTRAKKDLAKAENIMDAAMVAKHLPAPEVPEPPKAGADKLDFTRRRAVGDGLTPSKDEGEDDLVLGGDDFILQLAASNKGGILDGED